MYIIHEEKLSFNKIYGYYYDTKNPAIFDESEIKTNNISESDVHELFNVEKTNQISVFYALNSDIHTINQIIERSIKALTFDYDGIRYKRKNSKKLLQKLEIEKTHLEETIKKNDIDIYSFFYKKAKDRNNIAEFVEKGKKNEKYYNTYDVREQIYDNIRASLDFITSGKQMNIDEARERFKSVGSFEKLMRREITDMLNDDVSAKLMTAKIKNDFETYSTKKYMYLKSDGYDVDCLSMLFEVIKNFADINDKTLLELKKDYLEFQVSLIK
jgi:predicted  nucleic acid-binding Zn-ribbon protein